MGRRTRSVSMAAKLEIDYADSMGHGRRIFVDDALVAEYPHGLRFVVQRCTKCGAESDASQYRTRQWNPGDATFLFGGSLTEDGCAHVPIHEAWAAHYDDVGRALRGEIWWSEIRPTLVIDRAGKPTIDTVFRMLWGMTVHPCVFRSGPSFDKYAALPYDERVAVWTWCRNWLQIKMAGHVPERTKEFMRQVRWQDKVIPFTREQAIHWPEVENHPENVG